MNKLTTNLSIIFLLLCNPFSYASNLEPDNKNYIADYQPTNSDGTINAVIEIPAGLQNDLFDKLNELTHGEIETKILKVKYFIRI